MPAAPRGAGAEQSEVSKYINNYNRETRLAPAMTQAGTAASVVAAAVPASAGEQQQLRLAVLLLERGRHRDALLALQPLLVQRADSPELQCLQGCCLASLGSRPQASQVSSTYVSCSRSRLFLAAVWKRM